MLVLEEIKWAYLFGGRFPPNPKGLKKALSAQNSSVAPREGDSYRK